MSSYYSYKGQLYNADELKHGKFKYIRKEVKNGKTRYYYSYTPSLWQKINTPGIWGGKERQFYKDTPGEYGTYYSTPDSSDRPIKYTRLKSYAKRLFSEIQYTRGGPVQLIGEFVGTIAQKKSKKKKENIKKALSTKMAAIESRTLKRKK